MTSLAPSRTCLWIVFGSALIFAGGRNPAYAQSAENVAVVINDQSPASTRIGEHYIRSRSVPAGNVIRIHTTTNETITRSVYLTDVEGPVGAALRAGGLHDRILYIVLTKGVPLRIAGSDGPEGTVSSVDSELTLLYRRMTGREVAVRGRIANPYYLADASIATAPLFSHRQRDIYLVTRLDAFSVEEAIALIDRARMPSADGRFVLDQRAGLLSEPIGDRWLAAASRRLSDLGLSSRVVLESTTTAARGVENVLGYYSWGSNDAQNRVRRTEMRFAPGALAASFVSSDARTFQEPPAAWQPTGDWNNRSSWFGGSPQSLVGDLLREGATGVAGHIGEPYLQSTVRPEILFPAYASGLNLAEAFYLALPDLSWQTVVIGDPLCTAFPRKDLTSAEIDPGIDDATELPALFSARRTEVARAQYKGTPLEAIAHILRAEARFSRGDEAAGIAALERATALSPAFVQAQLQLATIHERLGNHPRARERYEQILAVESNNVIALNNLAYDLAVRQKLPDKALPLATRAAALAPDQPLIVDTLAWVQHLLGHSQEAATLLHRVVDRAAGNAEIHLHAAIVFEAVGDLPAAIAQLNQALKADPGLETHSDVRELRERLKRRKD